MKRILTTLFILLMSMSVWGQTESSAPSKEPIPIYVTAKAPMQKASYPLAAKIRGELKKNGCIFVSEASKATYSVVAEGTVETYGDSDFTSYDRTPKKMYVVKAQINVAIKDMSGGHIILNDIVESNEKFRDTDYNRAAKKAYDSLIPEVARIIKSGLN